MNQWNIFLQVVLDKVEKEEISYLLSKDQLLNTQHNKKAFCGFGKNFYNAPWLYTSTILVATSVYLKHGFWMITYHSKYLYILILIRIVIQLYL